MVKKSWLSVREARLEEVEILLQQAEQDIFYLLEVEKNLARIEKNRKKLAIYYEDEYMRDYEKTDQFSKHHRVLDQDSVWNALCDIYAQKLMVVKKIMTTIGG